MALGTRRPDPNVQLVHHSDQGSQGGFKRSSQRSIERSCDGQAEEAEVGSGWAAGDAVAGPSAGLAQGASAAVLGGDRPWRDRARRLAWRPVSRRRLVSDGSGRVAGCRRSAQAPLSGRYLSFAEREEIALLRAQKLRGAGDRAPARSLAVDDLSRAAS